MTPPTDRPKSTGSLAPPSRPAGTVSRRTFLAAGGTAALTSLAGCSALVDFVADFTLKDVNVFNGAGRQVNGTVAVADPAGDVVLEESFTLEANRGDTGDTARNDESAALYEGVWTETGDYEVSVELEERLERASSGDDEDAENSTDENSTDENADDSSGDESGSGTTASETVTISNTEEERLVIGLAQDDPEELIGFHVIENPSDLE